MAESSPRIGSLETFKPNRIFHAVDSKIFKLRFGWIPSVVCGSVVRNLDVFIRTMIRTRAADLCAFTKLVLALQIVTWCYDMRFKLWPGVMTCASNCDLVLWHVLQMVTWCYDMRFKLWPGVMTCASNCDMVLWHALQMVTWCYDMRFKLWHGVMTCP